MSSLADVPKLVGFFSYSRGDDIDSGGKLSDLRAKIDRELATQLGRDHSDMRVGRRERNFGLWQDKAAIQYGAEWETKINEGIAEAVFFIPIVTPRAVKSPKCRFEFESFLKRQSSLGRSDLIFPILYVRVPELDDEARWRGNEVLEVVASRQYPKWWRFRQHSVEQLEFAKEIEEFCASIVENLHKPWSAPQEAATPQNELVTEPASAPAAESVELPEPGHSPMSSLETAAEPEPEQGPSSPVRPVAAAMEAPALIALAPVEAASQPAAGAVVEAHVESQLVARQPEAVEKPPAAPLTAPQPDPSKAAKPQPLVSAPEKKSSNKGIYISVAVIAAIVLAAAAIVHWVGWSALLTVVFVIVGLLLLAASAEHSAVRNVILLIYFGPALVFGGVSVWNWLSGQQLDPCQFPLASHWMWNYDQACSSAKVTYPDPSFSGKFDAPFPSFTNQKLLDELSKKK
jgi:hypothetical protein